MARLGQARPGRRGMAGWRGEARTGEARLGSDWLGKARQVSYGEARPGKAG